VRLADAATSNDADGSHLNQLHVLQRLPYVRFNRNAFCQILIPNLHCSLARVAHSLATRRLCVMNVPNNLICYSGRNSFFIDRWQIPFDHFDKTRKAIQAMGINTIAT